MKQQTIVTDLVGVRVKVEIEGQSSDAVVRCSYLDQEGHVKLLVQTEDGKMVAVFATTQVTICRDYRGVPDRERK